MDWYEGTSRDMRSSFNIEPIPMRVDPIVLYTLSCVVTSVADVNPEGDRLKNHRYHSVHGDIYVTFSSGCWKPIFS